MPEPDENRLIDRLLGRLPGPAHATEPTSRELVARLAGELAGARGVPAAEFLAEHPEVAAAARAGLEELEWLEAGGAHAVLAVAAPPLRLAAASPGDAPPVPEDRRVLDEQPGRYRLTWHREGEVAHVTLFLERPADVRGFAARLDGVALAVRREGEAVIIADVGRPAQLMGRRLEVELTLGDATRVRSWTLVPE